MLAHGHLAGQFGHDAAIATCLLTPPSIALGRNDLREQVNVGDADIFERSIKY